jgi:hypothetical protein
MAPVQSVAGKTGTVTLAASELTDGVVGSGPILKASATGSKITFDRSIAVGSSHNWGSLPLQFEGEASAAGRKFTVFIPFPTLLANVGSVVLSVTKTNCTTATDVYDHGFYLSATASAAGVWSVIGTYQVAYSA